MNASDIAVADIQWELQPGQWPSNTQRDEDIITGDHLPDALQILALGEARALQRVADIERERDVYRFLLQEAIHHLADYERREHQWEARYIHLLLELRELRKQRRPA